LNPRLLSKTRMLTTLLVRASSDQL